MTENTETIPCRGVSFPLDPEIITTRIARKLRGEIYETSEIVTIERLLSPGARVLELGGGLGFVSSFALLNCKVEHVTCVEANPILCDYIRRVHAANGITAAKVINGAVLADTAPEPANGMLPFYVSSPFWSSSLKEHPDGRQTRISVPALRIGALVEKCQPTVLICDIEGGELGLFDATPLDGVTHVVIELHTRAYRGEGVQRVFDSLHRLGFYYHQKYSRGDVVTFARLATARNQTGSISPAARVA